MGKLMVGMRRLLSFCALLLLVLPALATSQPTLLTVQSVLTQDAGGNNKAAFSPGEPIRFVAQLNNSYGVYLRAANWTQVAITTNFYNDTSTVDIPPGISMWTWNLIAPSEERDYTVTVYAYDSIYGVWVEGSANFTVERVRVTVTSVCSVTLQPDHGTVGTGITATGRDCPKGALLYAFFN
jgi:hypothetical protein